MNIGCDGDWNGKLAYLFVFLYVGLPRWMHDGGLENYRDERECGVEGELMLGFLRGFAKVKNVARLLCKAERRHLILFEFHTLFTSLKCTIIHVESFSLLNFSRAIIGYGPWRPICTAQVCCVQKPCHIVKNFSFPSSSLP